ncbi:2-amino-4-hydroxy-6-hydroxymethyldihydropteridine diphosphokinase [Campylobacter sp. faydin G-24]|uniref:2-amino-4-hydroxy-6-hydroxymethyldihydropteridine pyrophosphokinase n=1 Tax=Campylobacter anatolicus TaxID=2829105 RepID=A0ABS5HJY5_9BACT|nr:2-amino-4-hydroxy-6-hydroxymethyldihydropteridine diphosphokinase [Campylobacter anatolicus]MBR8461918.1 2-amino-4-hydroxy-6-hydroxymethyldihydropteridine diphosphokinase [Campylobacter anatolicus]MBR8464315.1 2-amino-4-hydroxy-6-hydroxymethyldihydropteridine diphosphokinase [Campylobacter anatolicus]
MKLVGARRLIKSRFCHAYFGFKSGFKFSTFLGLGGNIGDTRKRFDKFIRVLMDDRRFHLVEVSPILENAAFGYTAQADFSNAVISLQTSLSPNETLKIMQRLELKFGRKRSFKNAPRTLDIDILYFSTKVRKTERLIVPHKGSDKRLSVIVPLGLMRVL